MAQLEWLKQFSQLNEPQIVFLAWHFLCFLCWLSANKGALAMNNQISNIRNVSKFFDNQHLLTVPQLSEWLQIPQKTIRDWVYKRQIPFLKVGRLIRFRSREIEAWINPEV